MVKDDSDRLSVLRDELRRRLGEERFSCWLGARAALALAGDELSVLAETAFELSLLRRRLHDALVESCASAWGATPTIEYVVLEPALMREAVGEAAEKPSAVTAPLVVAPVSIAEAPVRSGVTARRTFDDFVVGACNQMAAQTALDAARRPGRFSPLLFSGPPGCGKTHLLTAIEHAVRTHHGRVRALSLTAEQFTSQFVEALDRRALPGFRHKARSVDFLLIDDVQFFANKKATMDELLYTIDALQTRGGQVVLAGDGAAEGLSAVSPELACRVSAGLTVTLEPPDYPTRMGILRTIAARVRVALDEPVVERIAQVVVGSGRMMAGAINRLVAVSMALSKPISVELADLALAEFCRQHVPQVRLVDIQRAVCDVFGVEGATLRSPRKSRSAAEPRMLAMWLARRYTRAALSEIGEFFGGRSHSTVASAKKKFDGLVSHGGEIVVGDRMCHIEEAVRRIEAKLRTG